MRSWLPVCGHSTSPPQSCSRCQRGACGEDAVLNEAASWFVDTTSAGKKPGEGEGLGHKEPEKARVER